MNEILKDIQSGKEWGLVFAGGGAKGAYQMGVWKALREYGLDKKVTEISGASIGAIHAALFAANDYEIGKKIWEEITPSVVFDFDPKKLDGKEGIFSRKEMIKLMDEYLDMEAVRNSLQKVYISVSRLEPIGMKTEYMMLNKKSNEEIKKILLASSALPVIYEAVEMNGALYRDGGLTDNVPIKPIFQDRIRNVIVVCMSKDTKIQRELYPGVNFLLIKPNQSLGNLVEGTLNFSKKDIKMRMELGYTDAITAIKMYFTKPEVIQERNQQENILSHKDNLLEPEQIEMTYEEIIDYFRSQKNV